MRYLVANWKMNPPSRKEAEDLVGKTKKNLKKKKGLEIVVCPPFCFLETVRSKIDSFKLGAQNCFWEKKGSYTGEVSPLMLKKVGCSYVILGHSERRRYFGETNGTIKKKLDAALKAGLKPILCIGETAEERNKDNTQKVLKTQLNVLSELRVLIAYEPVWAIGSGNPCPPKEAGKTLSFIKEETDRPVLYGGSTDSQNARGFIEAGFDGVLVGEASLNPREFGKIAETLAF